MNPSRPVLPFILLCAGVWFVLAVIVCGCLIAVAGKGQSILAKLLYAIGGLCLSRRHAGGIVSEYGFALLPAPPFSRPACGARACGASFKCNPYNAVDQAGG
jgi:hypothetical protein